MSLFRKGAIGRCVDPPMDSEREMPGAVTIFLLLITLLVTAVLLVSVEGARSAAGRLYFKQAAQAAAESTMAAYRSDLWETYRLLFQYEDEALEAEARTVFERYAAETGAGGLMGFSGGSVRVLPADCVVRVCSAL